MYKLYNHFNKIRAFEAKEFFFSDHISWVCLENFHPDHSLALWESWVSLLRQQISVKTRLFFLFYDDNKIKMARKPGKKHQKNPVGWTGKGKSWKWNIREGKTELSLDHAHICKFLFRKRSKPIVHIKSYSNFLIIYYTAFVSRVRRKIQQIYCTDFLR